MSWSLSLLLLTFPTPDLSALEDVRETDPPLECLAPFVRRDYAEWAWKAARELEDDCDRMASDGPERWRECWQKRGYGVYVQRVTWGCLRDAWDESRSEADRRKSLAELRDRLGPNDFYAGRMPPPLPPWAVPPCR